MRDPESTGLMISAIFGVISGVLFISSFVIDSLMLTPKGYSDPSILVNILFFIMIGVTYGVLVIFGSLAVLFASMSIERRGVLALFVFLASVFAMLGSLFFLSTIFLGPLGSDWQFHYRMMIKDLNPRSAGLSRFPLPHLPDAS